MVNYVWPLELRDRALTFMVAENEADAKAAAKNDLMDRRARALATLKGR